MTAPNDLIPKGLVVVGSRPGEGTAVAQICNHPLVPVANKPLLLYGCDALSRAGVRELGIVASSDAAAELREALADGVGRDLRLTYLEGDQPGGLAEAILRAEAFLDGERFILHTACSGRRSDRSQRCRFGSASMPSSSSSEGMARPGTG